MIIKWWLTMFRRFWQNFAPLNKLLIFTDLHRSLLLSISQRVPQSWRELIELLNECSNDPKGQGRLKLCHFVITTIYFGVQNDFCCENKMSLSLKNRVAYVRTHLECLFGCWCGVVQTSYFLSDRGSEKVVFYLWRCSQLYREDWS